MFSTKDFNPKPVEPKGFFSVQVFDENKNLIDEYEDRNLIVFDARIRMAALIASKIKNGINSIVLGTRGHDIDSGNILVPKVVGQDGYDDTRKQLFSQEDGNFWYRVYWNANNLVNEQGDPVQWENNRVKFVATGNPLKTVKENAKIPVTMTLNDNLLEFEFEIGNLYANGEDGGSVVAYTEAGLFCDSTQLFSIKCFPAKVKQNTSSFTIKWKIVF